MMLIGVTLVVLSLSVVVNLKGASLKVRDLEYQIREENLQKQLDDEAYRSAELEALKKHVRSDEYIEEVAKEKLGLVKPDEILLKPSEN